MCGIVGILIREREGSVDPAILTAMRETLAHRGPDDCGMYIDGRIGFAHRRLSVIDLESGSQPMSGADGKVWLNYNGEIYNYRELRTELEALGHDFKTRSDTEVLLQSYLQWGVESVTRLNGMFAFAIWDARSETLLLVRDRLGIKPLYWTQVGDQFLFASEVKAFMHHPQFSAEPDLDAISSYLTFRQAVWDLCFFKCVNKVLPGHLVTVHNGNISTRPYWKLPVPRPDESFDESGYKGQVRQLLSTSVKRRMIADVPVGAYLSGGLDSSLVVAFMSEHSPGNVNTFSIGYQEDEYNEERFANAVSQHFGTNHLQLILSQEDYFSLWRKLIRRKDAPLSIPHEVALFQLSVELKKHVTVALSGEGADELFGGYGRVQRSPMDWKKIAFARSILGSRLTEQIGSLLRLSSAPWEWLRCKTHMDHFFRIYNWVPFEEKWDLMTEDALKAIDRDSRTIGIFAQIFEDTVYANPYDRILHIFQKIHLGCLLDRLDMMSMAASVEARVPFVDHELVEFVINMPVRYKLRWNSNWSRFRALFHTSFQASEWLDTSKHLLRQIGLDLLPREIATRKKLGFPTPLDVWLKEGMKEYAYDVLLDRTARERGIFDPKRVEELLDKTQNLPYDFYGKKVWMLMNVEIWFRELVDQS